MDLDRDRFASGADAILLQRALRRVYCGLTSDLFIASLVIAGALGRIVIHVSPIVMCC